jgi:hypothetical protein
MLRACSAYDHVGRPNATDQTFKGVIEMIVQMYELRANLDPSALRKSQL